MRNLCRLTALVTQTALMALAGVPLVMSQPAQAQAPTAPTAPTAPPQTAPPQTAPKLLLRMELMRRAIKGQGQVEEKMVLHQDLISDTAATNNAGDNRAGTLRYEDAETGDLWQATITPRLGQNDSVTLVAQIQQQDKSQENVLSATVRRQVHLGDTVLFRLVTDVITASQEKRPVIIGSQLPALFGPGAPTVAPLVRYELKVVPRFLTDTKTDPLRKGAVPPVP